MARRPPFVPLKVLCDKFSHTRFEPSGWSGHPKIGYAKSLMDYVVLVIMLSWWSKGACLLGISCFEHNISTDVMVVQMSWCWASLPRPNVSVLRFETKAELFFTCLMSKLPLLRVSNKA